MTVRSAVVVCELLKALRLEVDTIKTSQRGRKPARRFAVTRQWGGHA